MPMPIRLFSASMLPLFTTVILGLFFFRTSEEETTHGGFHEDWSSEISNNRWLALRKQWGKGNNGCVPELISLEDDIVDGVKKKVIVFRAQGNLSKSKITGVKVKGEGYQDTKRPDKVGSMIASREYFASGSYEVKMKVGGTNDNPSKPPVGLVIAIFPFHYEEHFSGDNNPDGKSMNPLNPQYQPRFKEKTDGLYYSTVNSEIDAPELGFEGDFSTGLFNTYINTSNSGIHAQKIKLPVNIFDGKYHTYRFDWHTELLKTDLNDSQVVPKGFYYYAYDHPESTIQGFPVIKKSDCQWYVYLGSSVDFYLDGKKIGESNRNVSPVSARLTIGGWFADWAGIPDWDEAKIYVSEINFTPYHDEGDVIYQPETYPVLGLVPLPIKCGH